MKEKYEQKLKKEAERIRLECSKHLTLRCDEYHYHTVKGGCFHIPDDVWDVVSLCEYINILESKIGKIRKALEE